MSFRFGPLWQRSKLTAVMLRGTHTHNQQDYVGKLQIFPKWELPYPCYIWDYWRVVSWLFLKENFNGRHFSKTKELNISIFKNRIPRVQGGSNVYSLTFMYTVLPLVYRGAVFRVRTHDSSPVIIAPRPAL